VSEIKRFENREIRSVWDNEKEEWYFSVVDVVGVLTESANPRRYWSDLKRKLKEEEGADQLYEKIVQLKLKAPDGKMRETDVADMQSLFLLFHFYTRGNQENSVNPKSPVSGFFWR
jgi:prophage antirepressor-like protein